ncbi:PLC-like phosphodiesterase [Microdochium trichocladiopsis]|uniref:PLC-like phosphodiesterase n=1 Tax=Microdochium trichocladiopsis TaxID=1682393 RepID=A0A9P9BN71_9PEZI|nr:PLC-like phosphodiesterase [Microdochium trichocladiopsis]KAH7030961.1 PLC-like phosphodiesterase [Microdochium trichocladiopsis]
MYHQPLLALLALALSGGTAFGQEACNGSPALCSRPYGDVTFVASHNAAFVGRGPAHNQFEYPEAGLSQGVRYFTTQTHIEDGEIRQCHSDCFLLNAGAFSEILVSLKSWMERNPREVVTLLVTNGDDDIRVEEFAEVFESTGTTGIVFTPGNGQKPGMDGWPTLGEMINSGKRLVVFMDYNADPAKVPYILPQYDYYVETPFSPTSSNFFNCDVDRPSSGASADNRMIFANHNLNLELFAGLLVPDQDSAAETNSVANIRQQTEICVASFGRAPNVVMLDFVSVGQAIEAQKQLNGL